MSSVGTRITNLTTNQKMAATDNSGPKTPNYGRQVGLLKGHTGWVTQIYCSPNSQDIVFSCSRDKTILIWKLVEDGDLIAARKVKQLISHNHIVSDCSISKDGGFMVTSSWDKLIKLWDIEKGVVKSKLAGHTNDVMSVKFSEDNRQIVSGSRDRTVRLWNTLGVNKFTFKDEGHTECVSSVLTRSSSSCISIFSAGYDGLIKQWELNPTRCAKTYHGHTNAINSMSFSPDYNTLASASKDGSINIWNMGKSDTGNNAEMINKIEAGAPVNCIDINPSQQIIAAGVKGSINLYSINGNKPFHSFIPVDVQDRKTLPEVTSIRWSNNGDSILAGYSDSNIRVFIYKNDAK